MARTIPESQWTPAQRQLADEARAKFQKDKAEAKSEALTRAPGVLGIMLNVPAAMAQLLQDELRNAIAHADFGKRLPSRTSLILQLIEEALEARAAARANEGKTKASR